MLRESGAWIGVAADSCGQSASMSPGSFSGPFALTCSVIMPIHRTRQSRPEDRQRSKESSPFATRPFGAPAKRLLPGRPLQRQRPEAEGVVQRYITDEEGHKMSYSDIWDEIGEAVDGTEDEVRLNQLIQSDKPFKLSQVLALLEQGRERMVLEPTPVQKIKAAKLTTPTILQNSRAKTIYLFDSEGNPTTSKPKAAYMVDTAMDEVEYKNYLKVESWGVRVPRIFDLKDGHPIVQWLPKQITVGGGGGKPLWNTVKQSIMLDKMTNKGFNKTKWETTLSDVKELIGLNYSSRDLQFMIEEDSGHIYIMDLEANNAPVLLDTPDRRLIDLREFLIQAISENS